MNILGVPNGVALAAGMILDELRAGPRTKVDLIAECEMSPMTVHRALAWLRELGAPVVFDRLARQWVLDDPEWPAPRWTLGRHGLYAERERPTLAVQPVHHPLP